VVKEISEEEKDNDVEALSNSENNDKSTDEEPEEGNIASC